MAVLALSVSDRGDSREIDVYVQEEQNVEDVKKEKSKEQGQKTQNDGEAVRWKRGTPETKRLGLWGKSGKTVDETKRKKKKDCRSSTKWVQLSPTNYAAIKLVPDR